MKTTVKVDVRAVKPTPGDEICTSGVFRLDKSAQAEYIGHLYIFSPGIGKFVSINKPGESRCPGSSDHYTQVKSMRVSDVEFV